MAHKEVNNQKVISQVNQCIKSLSKECQEKIPVSLKYFFEENDLGEEKYLLNFDTLNIDELEEETKGFLSIIGRYLKDDIVYEKISPSWINLEIEGKIKEAALQLEKELAKNFFNISNFFSDRELTDVQFIYNIRYFGRTFDEKKKEKLEPYKALCNVFCLMHEKYNVMIDYPEMLESYKIVYTELKKLM